MEVIDIPTKFVEPWGVHAGVSYIRTVPVASQILITPGAASLNDGFPPLCSVPVASGGIPPFMQDQNGILNQITKWLQWSNVGGPIPYDSTFQAAISPAGYPKGAVVQSATTVGVWWLSLADDNTTNPDTGGSGWLNLASLGPNFVAATGAQNAWTATIPIVPATLPDGYPAIVRFGLTNSTGSATFNAAPLLAQDGSTALPPGWLPLTALLSWNAANSGWVVLNATSSGVWTEIGNYTITGDDTASFVLNGPGNTPLSQMFKDLLITGCTACTGGSYARIRASHDNGSSYTAAADLGFIGGTDFNAFTLMIPGYAFVIDEVGVAFPSPVSQPGGLPGSLSGTSPTGDGAAVFIPFQSGSGLNALQIAAPPGYYFWAPTFTASIGASFTGSGSGTNLTIGSVTGLISAGDTVLGSGVPANTVIVSQTSGTTGGAGVYVTNNATTSSAASLTTTSTVLDVTAVAGGWNDISSPEQFTGIGVTAGTCITGLGTGTGTTGTYTISAAQNVPSTTMTISCVFRVFGR